MKKVVMFTVPYWYFFEDSISAERAFLTRLFNALDHLGYDYILTDSSGNVYDLKTNKKTALTHNDFNVIAHFTHHYSDFPFFDVYSIMPLWNPVIQLTHPEVYIHGVKKIDNVHNRSHRYFQSYKCYDDFTMASDREQRIFNQFIIGQEQVKHDTYLPYMASVSKTSIIEPKQTFEKIFYIGSGWETHVPGKPARHAYELSNLSKLNLLDVYGAKNVWGMHQGAVNYMGEIPPDGKTIFEKINNSGITLALSSDDHLHSNIVTNRIFEGIAAGSVIISNLRGKVYEMFGDNVLYVDATLNNPQRLQQIIAHYQWIQDNPDQARQKVINTQKALAEQYCLEVLFENIMNELPKRQKSLQEKRELNNHSDFIDVLYKPNSDLQTIKSDLQQIIGQNYQKINLIAFTKQEQVLIEEIFNKNKQHQHQLTIVSEFNEHHDWSLLMENWQQQNTNNQYITVFMPGTLWKHNHLSILMRSLSDNPQQNLVIANSASVESGLNNTYKFNDLNFKDCQKLYEDMTRFYVSISAMLIRRPYFEQTITTDISGVLGDLMGIYLLMNAIREQTLIQSQYLTSFNDYELSVDYCKDITWEKRLLIRYLFPDDLYIKVASQDAEMEELVDNQERLDDARIEYVKYKNRWKQKNIVGKITSFYKLRKLRDKYKKLRDR